MDTPKLYPRLAALFGAAAVVVGAFGAHLLEAGLEEAGHLETYRTGVDYHFYHVLAMLAIAIGVRGGWNRWHAAACWCFAAGIVLFSGSLYALSLSGIGVLGAITPLGGTAFIVGWVLLIPASRG